MKEQSMEIASAGLAASAASKVTYSGAAVSFGGWFLSSQFFGLMGLFIGFAGLAVNWYYRHKEYRLKERESLARLSELAE